jgi:FAD/FMN-containing dehydrogenase
LQDAVERQGIVLSARPASRADCSVGGTVATNAGGPRCLKYGVTRDYVLGLQAVLADGAVVALGGRTHKNKTGFDLTRLMVGSEGLLGVVTEVTLKLIPLPPFRALLVVGFDSMKAAARAIRAIFADGFLPSALEVADEFTLEAAARRTGSRAAGRFARLADGGIGWPGEIGAERRPSPGPAAPGARAGLCAARLRAAGVRESCGACAASFPIPCATRALSN